MSEQTNKPKRRRRPWAVVVSAVQNSLETFYASLPDHLHRGAALWSLKKLLKKAKEQGLTDAEFFIKADATGGDRVTWLEMYGTRADGTRERTALPMIPKAGLGGAA